VGGTHGNERTGVALVEHLEAQPQTWPGLELRTLLANPEAIAQNRRFVDRDLNRSFRPSDLGDAGLTDHEMQRARVLAAELRPAGVPAVDFIVDLHTTTSNMGVSLLLASRNQLELELCAHLTSTLDCRTLLLGGLWEGELPYLKTLAPASVAIEVGPIPQGILRHDILERTREALYEVLDYLGRPPTKAAEAPRTLAAYEAVENVEYPEDAGGRRLLLHRDLQDRDWVPLEAGQPLFVSLGGTVERCSERWQGLCPVFINEAAYYPKTAFVLTRPTTLHLDP
jgi:aspartoacylase